MIHAQEMWGSSARFTLEGVEGGGSMNRRGGNHMWQLTVGEEDYRGQVSGA